MSRLNKYLDFYLGLNRVSRIKLITFDVPGIYGEQIPNNVNCNLISFKPENSVYVIPDKFDKCFVTEMPSDKEELANLRYASLFAPAFDRGNEGMSNLSHEYHPSEDVFYFKTEFFGAKFKEENNQLIAEVKYWIKQF